jgi:hypothetical protein
MTVALAPETLAPLPAGSRRRRRPWRGPRWDGPLPVPAVALVVLVLWLVSLPAVDLRVARAGDLPAGLPPTWFLALGGAVLLHLAVVLSRRVLGRHVAVCQGLLVAVLTGTAAVAGGGPRPLPVPADLAPLVHLLGRLPETDRWAPPALALLTAAAGWWFAGGLSTSHRARAGAVLLATLGGQLAAAPSPALPASLLLLGGLLRTVPAGPGGVRWAPLRRLGSHRDDVPPAGRPSWSSRGGAAALLGLFALVAGCGGAAPAVLLAQAAAVCALLRPARPWLVLAFLAVEEAELLRAQEPVGDLLRGAGGPLRWPVLLLVALVVLLALGCAVAALLPPGRGGRVVVPATLALLALGIAPAGPDGGLAAGHLLALPALATVAALVLLPERPGRPALQRVLAATAVLLVAAAAVPASLAGG